MKARREAIHVTFLDTKMRDVSGRVGGEWLEAEEPGSTETANPSRIPRDLGSWKTGKKKVWTMFTLSTPDCPVHPPNWPGFRMFPPLPSVHKARNPVRVPPRARHTPSSEGVFALMCVHSGWSGPSDAGRGLCLAPRVACLVVGSGFRGLAGGPSAGCELGLYVPLLLVR